MKKNINKIFMSFSKGKDSGEAGSFKKYIGVASVFVVGLNPSKEELEKLYGTTLDKDPEYLGETETGPEGNKKKVKQIRVDVIVKTDSSKGDVPDMTTRVSFYITDSYRYNRDQTKVEVINKYGETTWLPIENAKNHTIPENLKWFEAGDFRPAYIGEEELTGFIKTYLNIPNKSFKKADGTVQEIPNKADAEARLDNIKNYFKGDITELKQALQLQPNNKLKALFGVKKTQDNKEYQTVFTRKFLKNGATDYSYLEKELANTQAAGGYPNCIFEVCPLKEYTVEATDFSKAEPQNAPEEEKDPWA